MRTVHSQVLQYSQNCSLSKFPPPLSPLPFLFPSPPNRLSLRSVHSLSFLPPPIPSPNHSSPASQRPAREHFPEVKPPSSRLGAAGLPNGRQPVQPELSPGRGWPASRPPARSPPSFLLFSLFFPLLSSPLFSLPICRCVVLHYRLPFWPQGIVALRPCSLSYLCIYVEAIASSELRLSSVPRWSAGGVCLRRKKKERFVHSPKQPWVAAYSAKLRCPSHFLPTLSGTPAAVE